MSWIFSSYLEVHFNNNNLMDEIRLIADARERNVLRHKDVLSAIKIETKTITTGDYVVANNKCIFAVIERKSFEDYAASLSDGRHNNRKKLLTFSAKTKCKVIYIVEGPEFPSPTDLFGRIPYRHIESSMFHLMIRDNIMIIRTKDTLDTANTLVRFVKSMATLPIEFGELNDSPSNNIINGDVDLTIVFTPDSETLLEMLTEVKEKSIDEVVRNMWSKFPGISMEAASEYMNKWSIADIIRGRILVADINASKTSTGRAVTKKVIDILCNVPKLIQIKLLSGVPGISLNTAKTILEHSTLSSFLSQGTEGIELFMLGKRRIGKKLSEKILLCFEYKTEIIIVNNTFST